MSEVRWDFMNDVCDYPQHIYATTVIQLRLELSSRDEPPARLDNVARCWDENHVAFGSYVSNESNILHFGEVQVQKNTSNSSFQTSSSFHTPLIPLPRLF